MVAFFDKAENKLAKYKACLWEHPKIAAMKFIWWNLKYLCSIEFKRISFNDNKQHIGITIAGGIGDYFFAAKYTEALSKYLSKNCVIDVLSEERDLMTIKTIFHGKGCINEVLPEKVEHAYDLHIRLIRFPVIVSYNKSRLDSRTLQYVAKLEEFYGQNSLTISNDYMGRCWSDFMGRKRENQADIENILNMSEMDFAVDLSADEEMVLRKFGLEKFKFITIQTGAGAHFQHIKNETRQWPIEYYCELVKILKNEYPQYKIVQLGVEYQSLCSDIDLDLRGKTEISELFVLLKNAKLHISQEGGMPIIRHFVKGGKSVVLFGPTDEKFFGFEENINISARPCNTCCEWLTKDWMKKCIKTGGCAECIQILTPELVMNEINKLGVLK